MKTDMHERVQKLKDEGYEVDFNSILTHAIEIYKKTFLWTGLALLLFSIVFGSVIVLILLFAVGVDKLQGDPEYLNQMLKDPINLAIYIVCTMIIGGFATPFTAGVLEMAHKADKKIPFNLATAFEFYADRKFGKLFVIGMVVGLISSAVSTGIEILHFPGFQFVSIVFSFVFGFLTLLAIPLIIYGRFGPLDALGSSCSLMTKQFLLLVGLYIVSIFIGIAGFLGCCIGMLFTIPFMYAMIYAMYNAIVGFPAESPTDAGISDIQE